MIRTLNVKMNDSIFHFSNSKEVGHVMEMVEMRAFPDPLARITYVSATTALTSAFSELNKSPPLFLQVKHIARTCCRFFISRLYDYRNKFILP